jgi:hypothetical protein
MLHPAVFHRQKAAVIPTPRMQGPVSSRDPDLRLPLHHTPPLLGIQVPNHLRTPIPLPCCTCIPHIFPAHVRGHEQPFRRTHKSTTARGGVYTPPPCLLASSRVLYASDAGTRRVTCPSRRSLMQPWLYMRYVVQPALCSTRGPYLVRGCICIRLNHGASILGSTSKLGIRRGMRTVLL